MGHKNIFQHLPALLIYYISPYIYIYIYIYIYSFFFFFFFLIKWKVTVLNLYTKFLSIPIAVSETLLLQLQFDVSVCVRPSGFVRAITSTFVYGFQNNLAQVLEE